MISIVEYNWDKITIWAKQMFDMCKSIDMCKSSYFPNFMLNSSLSNKGKCI